jgi:hypothetical protein
VLLAHAGWQLRREGDESLAALGEGDPSEWPHLQRTPGSCRQ